MLLEQYCPAREQKKKCYKRIRVIQIGTAVLLAAGVCFGIWGRQLVTAESRPVMKITSEAGQEIIFAKLSSIKGNEITYIPVEEEKTTVAALGGESFTYENITYRLTEETVTAQIPVGTEVTTKLGAVTTFSRLSAGDYVALVVEESGEEEIITAVYIVG